MSHLCVQLTDRFGTGVRTKTKEEKNSKLHFSPRGGLNPRMLDLKFTALTTRPKELTQDIKKNDGAK